MRESVSVLVSIVKFLIYFLLSGAISVFLIITFGLAGRVSMNGGIVIGSVLVALLLLWGFKKHYKTKNTVFFFVIGLLLVQYVLLVITPRHTLLPVTILYKLDIVKDTGIRCPDDYKSSLRFFENAIDTSKVEFYGVGTSSLTKWLSYKVTSGASTWGNFVYINEKYECGYTPVIVHELTHVWQYQDGQGFGMAWIPKWVKYMYVYFTDFESMYDYGGTKGLEEAVRTNKKFREFNLEQQATIVQHYYTNACFIANAYSYECSLLEHFVEPNLKL